MYKLIGKHKIKLQNTVSIAEYNKFNTKYNTFDTIYKIIIKQKNAKKNVN